MGGLSLACACGDCDWDSTYVGRVRVTTTRQKSGRGVVDYDLELRKESAPEGRLVVVFPAELR
eukprot:COSAG01_NODE_2322_length_7910_cov_16.209960_11_plen_63_part_00